MIRTAHIQTLLDTAARIAQEVNGHHPDSDITIDGKTLAAYQWTRRAAGLAIHAHAELLDEYDRADADFPDV